jgi:uncharacterized protein YndB with AHSA1/START domain
MKTISREYNPDAALKTERVISSTPEKIFASFGQPDKFARWWGPKGFTNTFEQFEFKPGGKWVFIMHGPNEADYANECVFREIVPYSKIVIEHVVEPWFMLRVILTARADKTHLSWTQEFESPEMAASLSAICDPANEENLDRLEALLESESL